MNHFFRYFSFLLLFGAASCKKATLLHEGTQSVVKVRMNGYIMSDTLDTYYNGVSTGALYESSFGEFSTGVILKPGKEVLIRKRSDGTKVSQFVIADTPFNQVIKLFYDGATLSDNIEVTPVSNPANTGIRLSFSTPFADFYGGPVDIEIFHSAFDWNLFSYTFTSVKKIVNVTSAFGDFFELPPLPASDDITYHAYALKVYKAGTTELPYSSMDKVLISDPENNYGQLPFVAGGSQLLIISPGTADNNTVVTDGYQYVDIASAFR